MNKLKSNEPVHYNVEVNKSFEDKNSEDLVIAQAKSILENRMNCGPVLNSPGVVKDFLIMQNAEHSSQEVFSAIFLDSQHRKIKYEKMFFGTLTQTSVYPRELAKVALQVNASAVIVSHNHPSGDVTPSSSDIHLTKTLKSALGLIDINLLDHIITGGSKAISLAERGDC